MNYLRTYLDLLGGTLSLAVIFALVTVPLVVGSRIQYGLWTLREPTSPVIWAGIIVAEIFVMPAGMVILGWASRTFGGDGR